MIRSLGDRIFQPWYAALCLMDRVQTVCRGQRAFQHRLVKMERRTGGGSDKLLRQDSKGLNGNNSDWPDQVP